MRRTTCTAVVRTAGARRIERAAVFRPFVHGCHVACTHPLHSIGTRSTHFPCIEIRRAARPPQKGQNGYLAVRPGWRPSGVIAEARNARPPIPDMPLEARTTNPDGSSDGYSGRGWGEHCDDKPLEPLSGGWRLVRLDDPWIPGGRLWQGPLQRGEDDSFRGYQR